MDNDKDLDVSMYHEPDDWELTPLVDALPREGEPGDLLEERTVRALRAAGLIGRRRAISRPWIAGAAAAAIALFASGVAIGQWIGSRNVADMLSAQRNADLQQTAAVVERTGSAYVQALSTLAESQQSRTSTDALYARETALATLHQAANQMVRLAPNDPVTASILQGLDQAKPRPPERRKERRVIWF
jgi:hypothetical protein